MAGKERTLMWQIPCWLLAAFPQPAAVTTLPQRTATGGHRSHRERKTHKVIATAIHQAFHLK